MALQIENLRGLGKGMSSALRLGVRGLHGPPKMNEYTEKAVYPKISPFKNDIEKRIYRTKEEVKTMKTVEEKMYQINRPKRFGWYSFMVKTNSLTSDILDWAKFSTCTEVVDGLPSQLVYDEEKDKQVDQIISQLGKEIELAIKNEEHIEYLKEVTNDRIHYSEKFALGKDTFTETDKEMKRSKFIIKRIHNLIHSHLSLTEPHILNSVENHKPRVEGFWFRGGIRPDKNMLKKRKGLQSYLKRKVSNTMTEKDRTKWEKMLDSKDDEFVNQAYERAIQVHTDSVLHMRHADPLAEFVGRDDELCTNVSIPIVDYDPRVFELPTMCQHGTNIPGCWPQDNNRMGMLAYHDRVNRYRDAEHFHRYPTEEVLRMQDIAKAIFSNFSWTLGQAVQLGFSPLTELTFPLVSQSVNTDGRLWSFFAYQMNSCDLSSNDHTSRTHQNLLWTHPTVQLYNKIEDGKLTNFDPDCLRPLIKMYLNKPKVRSYDMTPYLDPECPLVTDHPDPYQRKRFFDIVRDQLSNRPPSVGSEKPELYQWEKIKIVDNNAMPAQFALTRRRRWFHMAKIDPLGKEHWHPEFVNTDEKTNKYIPRLSLIHI